MVIIVFRPSDAFRLPSKFQFYVRNAVGTHSYSSYFLIMTPYVAVCIFACAFTLSPCETTYIKVNVVQLLA